MEEEVRKWIEREALDFIQGSYARWREKTAAGGAPPSEPQIGVTLIRDYLNQVGRQPDDWKFESNKRQSSWVRSVLDSLVRQGILNTSEGPGERKGTTTTLYDPGE